MAVDETILTPGAAQFVTMASKVDVKYNSIGTHSQRYSTPTAPKPVIHQVRAFRRIASTNDGPRNEKSLASMLISERPKRRPNNMYGQFGTERCLFCIKSKKKVDLPL
jgi:hypothetical protein